MGEPAAEEGEGEGSVVAAFKEAGTVVGKYTLLCKLATGGMGEIFVARQAGAGGFEKLVVIKRLLAHLAEDVNFVAMLLDEARIAARLSHPNVCQVYELGEADGSYYIAMEHLEGLPASWLLRHAHRAGKNLSLGLAGALLVQACDGLHHAHELKGADGQLIGLVHRDVSPSNLFVTVAGVVKLLDFGVAKSKDALARTHTGALKGKYAYMSPEQVHGKEVDRRADIWSLGTVAFELLTCKRLFWRESEYQMFQAIVEDAIPRVRDLRPEIPAELAEVVDRALSRDPAKRFDTAAGMGRAIERALVKSGGLAGGHAIAEHLTRQFGPTLAARREAVQVGIGVAANAVPRTPMAVDRMGDSIEIRIGDGHAGRRFGRWAAIAAVVGVGVGAAGFAILKMERTPKHDPPPPIVIEGGEVETSDGKVTRVGHKDAGPGATVVAVADAGPTAEPHPHAGSAPPRDPYRVALARREEAIKACFNQHATEVSGSPEVSVRLRIGEAGQVLAAELLPAELGTTPLGACLVGVARAVHFAKQDGEVEVTIPLRVRRHGG